MPLYYFTMESPDEERDTVLWFPHNKMALDYAAEIFPILTAGDAGCRLIVKDSEGNDVALVSRI
jgi:hypothetical protein